MGEEVRLTTRADGSRFYKFSSVFPPMSKDDISCLQNFESRQESVSPNTCLREYRTQGRALDPPVIGSGNRRPCSIFILTRQSNVVTTPRHLKPTVFRSPYDLLQRNIRRELGYHTATPVSAM